ncbi:MAG: glycosyltransferase family 4 protein [Planctomycetes bacterium]|nr:glycosyltransferase family 4 protein [Planctomycetota bacterium]
MLTLQDPRPDVQPLPARVSIDRPVRVLHVVPQLSSGGMERAMLRLIQRSLLHDRGQAGRSGVQHGICVLNDIREDLREQCPQDVPTWVFDGDRRGGRYQTWRRLRDVIQRFAPDVVHARSTGAWFDAAAAVIGLPRVRLLLSFHGCTTLRPPGWRRRLVDRWTTGRADAVLTVSREAAERLHKQMRVPGDKQVVIHNGVDTNLYCPAEADAEIIDIRRRTHLPPNADVAICVANLLPIKGLDLLVRAWRQVHMGDPLARLLLVGEGPLRGDLEQLIRQLRCTNIVRLLGNREDVPSLLRAADMFVLPSWYEGCSNATLEAMASGLPVLACDVGGMPELVAQNRTGWLVRPGDVEALSNLLLTVLLDRCLRHRVGAAGRDAAVKHFGIDTWVARHAALYRRLAGVRPPQHAPREDPACAE